jgi:hypothetical protein
VVDGVDVAGVLGGEDYRESDEPVVWGLLAWFFSVVDTFSDQGLLFTHGSLTAKRISVVDLVFHDICKVPKKKVAKMKMTASMRLPIAATAMNRSPCA